MTAAAVAALAAILGILVGRFWDNRSEASRWRRDLKTMSYQRFAEQYHRVYEGIRELALADRDKVELNALHQRVRGEYFAGWDSALAVVWLHGSADVLAAATLVDRASVDLYAKAVTDQIPTWQQFEKERVSLRQAFEEFLAAARRELHLPTAQMTFFWDTDLPELGERDRSS
ncbi:hypothetical protein VMT65_31105 [Nocardia sp. CDC153]|uniref:hypothetical protein n=1 Tax=Nocardia sp. CDC153 TaxID=3112167 RepID=UPI002DB8AFB6|nr:hypothetical protein [Nocardia sp. CDC153]MEC3957518.1 hypothetical protein [Nocardia sp. CDC153]